MIKPTKVRLQSTNSSQRHLDLYSQNKRELGFLPSVFIAFVLIAIFAGGVWYFRGVGEGGNVAGVLDSQRTPSNSVLDRLNSQSENLANSSDKTVINQNKLQVTTASGTSCDLNFQNDKPEEVPNLVSNQIQGFWTGQSCGDKNFIAVQITTLNDQQIFSLNNSLSPKNIQLLNDFDRVYALVFTKDSIDTTIDFKTFLQPITFPVFKKAYFDATAVFDLRRVNDDTFYLNGNCQAGVSACNLWKVNSFQGIPLLIRSNIVQLDDTLKSQLSKGSVFRFAKNQDLTGGLNFILVDEANPPIVKFTLVRFDFESNRILQILNVNLGETAYRDYYR